MRKYQTGDIAKVDWLDQLVLKQIDHTLETLVSNSASTYLYIQLPIFDFPIIFNEREYQYPENITLREAKSSIAVFDAELFHDNPVENKHRRLARSHRTGLLDRELKPNAKIRDELNVPPKLTPGRAQIPTNETAHRPRKRSPLEVPVLPLPRQESTHKIPQMRHMDRQRRVQTSNRPPLPMGRHRHRRRP